MIEAVDVPSLDSNLKAPQYRYQGKLSIVDEDEVRLSGPIRITRLDETVRDTIRAVANGTGIVRGKMFLGTYTMNLDRDTEGFGTFALKFRSDGTAEGYFLFKATSAQQDFGMARARLRKPPTK